MLVSRKINQDLKVEEKKPHIVNQQRFVCRFQYNLCDAGYVGYTRGHLNVSVDGHKQRSSLIYKHYQDKHGKVIGGHHRQKYRHNKWFVINRNGLIVFRGTFHLILRDLFKIQIFKIQIFKQKMVYLIQKLCSHPWFRVEMTNGSANCTLVQ